MTLDHLREIALIQISQAQRTNAMTVIYTTLYANGALRLSRHGAGRGETVLTFAATGAAFTVPDGETADLIGEIDKFKDCTPDFAFRQLQSWFAQPAP